MQSIGKLVSSQAAYYTEQLRHSVGEDVPVLRGEAKPAQVDYYANHESPSRWMGTGLGRVGLEPGGLVDPEVFCRLMGHQTPVGEAMSVSRSHGRVAAFDHTFSAPKSVSLHYASGDNRVRAEVTSAHQRAVSEALSYMEKRCSQSRLGVRYSDSAGDRRFTTQTLESEGYVAAAFDHYTSRANDPQVHTVNHLVTELDETAFAMTLAAKPAVISFTLGDPGRLVQRAHDAGSLVVHQVTTVLQASQPVERGVDVMIAHGSEAGGIGDGRGLAAALMLGALGVNVGTWFLASEEAQISPVWKQMIVTLPPRTQPRWSS